MIKNIKWLALTAVALTACNNNDEVVANNSSDGLPLTAGSANFSKYVALGNSLSAGYTDGALFIEGQKNSWTKILSDQFQLVGGGEFKIPFMPDNKGGALLGTIRVLENRLYFNGAGPARIPGVPTAQLLPGLTGQFNNMGVPGAKSFHLLAPGYGNPAGLGALPRTANPYFCRFASSATASVIGDAMAQQPTFFTLWIGNNDVLGYATSGGDGTEPITPSAGPAGVGFDATYNALVTTLTSAGAKGAVGLIPDITALPFFTTIVPNQIPALPATNAASLNNLFGGINAALVAAGLPPRFVTLKTDDNNPATDDSNPLLIIDETLPNISAQITAAFLTVPSLAPAAAFLGNQYGRARHARRTIGDRDYILITTGALINPNPPGNNIEPTVPLPLATFAVRGVSYPLQDQAVLTADEASQVKTATDAFNITIQASANAKDLAIVNTRAILNQVATTGLNVNGFNFTGQLVFGHAFSLDGVHPTARGAALIANEFAKSINAKYGSNLPSVNVGVYNNLWPLILP